MVEQPTKKTRDIQRRCEMGTRKPRGGQPINREGWAKRKGTPPGICMPANSQHHVFALLMVGLTPDAKSELESVSVGKEIAIWNLHTKER